MNARSAVLLIVLALAGTACHRNSKEAARLAGVWQSNKELTAETIRPTLKDLPEVARKILPQLGRMRIAYAGSTMHAELPAAEGFAHWSHRTSFSVLEATLDTLTIQPRDWPAGDNKPTVIHFVSPDRYWVQVDAPKWKGVDGSGWREYFDRVTK